MDQEVRTDQQMFGLFGGEADVEENVATGPSQVRPMLLSHLLSVWTRIS
jgi:hypothetical protein